MYAYSVYSNLESLNMALVVFVAYSKYIRHGWYKKHLLLIKSESFDRERPKLSLAE